MLRSKGRARWVLVVVALAAPVALAGSASHGALSQLPGTDGCVSQSGSSGQCADGRALGGASGIAASRDGKSVYVASQGSGAVAVFARNPISGVLEQLPGTAGCVSHGGNGGCAEGRVLRGASDVAVSADGTSVYVTAFRDDAVAVFARDPSTGALSQLPGTAGCVSRTGTGGRCGIGYPFGEPGSVAVSADGKNVYVGAFASDAVSVLSRDPVTGALTQLSGPDGCVSADGHNGRCADVSCVDRPRIAVSSGGENLYVAGSCVSIFARDGDTGALTQLPGAQGCVSFEGAGGCTPMRGLERAWDVAVSPDDENTYAVGSDDVLAIFDRDLPTGALSQLPGTDGCISETGTNAECADGRGLKNLGLLAALAAELDNVYATAATSGKNSAIAAFSRDAATGKLTQLPGREGCVSRTGNRGECAKGRALRDVAPVTASTDGLNLYAASQDGGGAVVVFARH